MSILSSFGVPIVMIGMLIAALAGFMVFARNYRKCPPNKVLVVYGRKNKQGQGFRLITGGSALVVPLLESFTEIGLENFSVEAAVVKTPNADGVPVSVDAVANVKVSSNPDLLSKAVERMLGKRPEEIKAMLKVTLDGLLRQIIGTLTIEEMVKDREKLAQGVLNNALTELNKLGFDIDNFVINKMWDDEGYIDAMGAKRTAEVKRDAEIAQAEAQREALIKSSAARQEGETARLGADERVAEAQRDLALKTAGFQKQTATAQADADMAGDMRRAELDKDLRTRRIDAQAAETAAGIALQEQEALRKEKELVATVIRPAEAKAKAATIEAEGNATASIRQADATKAVAEAEKVKVTLVGEGHAAAEAASRRLLGLADAEATRARGESEASAIRLKGEAEGATIAARLTAEATGLLKKNEAMDKMSDAARLIIFLDKLPDLIERFGDAGQKVVGAAFEPIGQAVSRIDSIHLMNMGSGNGAAGSDPISQFMGAVPETVFNMLARAKTLGVDLSGILKLAGIDESQLGGLLKSLNLSPSGNSAEGKETQA